MAGYLEEYGAGEEKQQNLIRNSVLAVTAILVLGGLGYYILHPIHQIGITKHFLSLVKAKDYAGAYAAWGCASPCKDYPLDKFLEDWGPKSAGMNQPILKITDAESCGNGVILTVNVAPRRQEKLLVEKGSDLLGFSPVPFCPGKGAWAIMTHRTLGRLRVVLF